MHRFPPKTAQETVLKAPTLPRSHTTPYQRNLHDHFKLLTSFENILSVWEKIFARQSSINCKYFLPQFVLGILESIKYYQR